MPLQEDLLNPIAGDNPSGQDVRYDNNLLLYDKIKEARRQDDNLAQGAWEHERKVADYALVVKLAQEALATRTKDLQLAAWLTESALRTEGFAGLRVIFHARIILSCLVKQRFIRLERLDFGRKRGVHRPFRLRFR